MKQLIAFLFSLVSVVGLAQDVSQTHQVMAGYGFNNIGKSGHLMYGYQVRQHLFYGGLRFHKNAPYNISDPLNAEVYRSDITGQAVGFIGGYQQSYPLNFSAISALWAVELEYAYLGSRQTFMGYDVNSGALREYSENVEARSLFIPSLNAGFEAQIYKGLYLRQLIGGTALFDSFYKRDYEGEFLSSFNGIGINLRFSLVYKF